MSTAEKTRQDNPPFPRPVTGFVGREGELQRARTLLPRETLFLIYGLAGIGKSEFAYKLVEEARALPGLRRAPAIALAAQAGMSSAHLLALLRAQLGGGGVSAGASGDRAALAQALEARPALVLIDDAHHLDGEAVGELLGFLARRVSRSRLFVASRLELLLPAGTPPPVISRLAPLSLECTAALVTSASHSLGLHPPDAATIYARSGGSPSYALRELADLRYAPRPPEDSLATVLAELAPAARHALLLARLLRGRRTSADLGELLGGATLWELSRRFLIDLDRGAIIVHDLIFETLLRVIAPADLQRARGDAAHLLLRRTAVSSTEPDLVIDLRRNVIRASENGLEVTGRPLLCALLAHVLCKRGVHSAERLFYEVWGGREYHPLRHRNTIYVAITRLRRALQGLLPGREVVETTPQGWRLADGVTVLLLGEEDSAPRAAPVLAS